MKIRLATMEVQTDSIVDGVGVRTVIWTQGCRHHCPFCHNPETHSFESGYLIDVDDVLKKIDTLSMQDGITFSGGDPMEQAGACAMIARYARDKGLNVWCYTGYTYEELISKNDKDIMLFLDFIDVLVDGKFDVTKKSFDCTFRGSSNQRLIDVRRSLSEKKVIEFKILNSNKTKKGRKNNYMFV